VKPFGKSVRLVLKPLATIVLPSPAMLATMKWEAGEMMKAFALSSNSSQGVEISLAPNSGGANS
jgi:hypothetical protein